MLRFRLKFIGIFTARLVNLISKSTKDSVAYDIDASFAVTVVVFADFDDFGDHSIGSFDYAVHVAVLVVTVVAVVVVVVVWIILAIVPSSEYLQIDRCILLLWLHLKVVVIVPSGNFLEFYISLGYFDCQSCSSLLLLPKFLWTERKIQNHRNP